MSAPTPISALLHSSTMVIAGIYLGLILSLNFNLTFYELCTYLFLFCSAISLLVASFIAFFIQDIKSIIAYSTISQIGYMLLGSLIVPSFALYHIFVHAFFKSLFFLLSSEIIHNSKSNWQSIYTLKIKTILQNSLLRVTVLGTVTALIFADSKEGLLNSLLPLMDSKFIFLIGILGAWGTTFYTILLLFFSRSILHFRLEYSLLSFFTLALSINFIDKIFSSIINFISSPQCAPFFTSTTSSIYILFLFIVLFLPFLNLVSLPYLSISPCYFLNFIPYLSSLSFLVYHIIESIGFMSLSHFIPTLTCLLILFLFIN